ncbi:hypothetical protein BU16DRAFT_81215 [Lophium mytilinum]|uniref:Transcription factor domain-containing protein n=1 Tax=Lophium mytilinum TaxID=390894 RepID=A0A6A6QNA9_9PEZI|nr:hypothetical protein BU16DRAFT_81215 [Lophium mytilinum]
MTSLFELGNTLSNIYRYTSASEILNRIEERLVRLEDSINSSRSEPASTPASIDDSRSAKSKIEGWRSYYQEQLTSPNYDNSFRQTTGEAYTARPSLVSFACPYYIHFDSWDDTSEFYDDEFRAERELYQIMDALSDHVPPTDTRTIWRLQKIAIKNFFQWMPLLSVEEFVHHVQVAQTSNFKLPNASAALSMLAFAFAEISEDRASQLGTQHQVFLPGVEYFQHGSKLLQELMPRERREIEVLQCRVLYVSYLQCTAMPLMAWDTIMEVGRDCMNILSSGYYHTMSTAQREAFHRVFWTSSIIMHELESILKMSPTGMRQFHEVVPLPQSTTEVEGFYHVFAQISLRKLLTEILDVVGYRVGQVIYAPIVATELRKQAQEWYSHLPPPVQFPINAMPLFELRKSYLRVQFVALHAVVLWPSVLQFLESMMNQGPEKGTTERLDNLQRDTRDCIKSCVLNCELAEELLMQRHLGLQFAIWSTYATMSMLLVTYRVPCLAHIPETRTDIYIRKAFTSLSSWEHLPVVHRGLERTRRHMSRVQIPLEDLIMQQ